jgi:hypothetical protein
VVKVGTGGRPQSSNEARRAGAEGTNAPPPAGVFAPAPPGMMGFGGALPLLPSSGAPTAPPGLGAPTVPCTGASDRSEPSSSSSSSSSAARPMNVAETALQSMREGRWGRMRKNPHWRQDEGASSSSSDGCSGAPSRSRSRSRSPLRRRSSQSRRSRESETPPLWAGGLYSSGGGGPTMGGTSSRY